MRPGLMHAFQHLQMRGRIEGRIGDAHLGHTHGDAREAVLADVKELGVSVHRGQVSYPYRAYHTARQNSTANGTPREIRQGACWALGSALPQSSSRR